jgi:integrase
MRIGKRSLEDLVRRWAAARANGGPVGRDIEWDDDLAGFGVRRQAAGGSATFVLKFRVKGDVRQRWVTLGDWPSVHPDTAREEARKIREAAALGRDLLGERRAEAERRAAEEAEAKRRAIPLAEVLDAWRASLEAAQRTRRAAGESGRTEADLLRLEAKALRPALVGQTVGAFDPDSLQSALDRATSRVVAQHIAHAAGRFAGFARSWLRERGIVADWRRKYEITQPRVLGRDHRYSLEEAARIWTAAADLGRRGALVRLMLLAGLRKSEVAGLRWPDVVLDDAVLGAHLVLPAPRVKNRRATRQPLSAPAVALLRWLPPRESRRFGASDLVFAGRANRPVGSWDLVKRDLLRRAQVPDGTLHDIRRTIVSTLGDHGWEPAVVDRVLNHAAAATMPGVMGVYQRSELWEQKRRALEAWADMLLGEVSRLGRRPVNRETWGFDQPFTEARIVRLRARRPSDRAGRSP